jgi:hypothetical protein
MPAPKRSTSTASNCWEEFWVVDEKEGRELFIKLIERYPDWDIHPDWRDGQAIEERELFFDYMELTAAEDWWVVITERDHEIALARPARPRRPQRDPTTLLGRRGGRSQPGQAGP